MNRKKYKRGDSPKLQKQVLQYAEQEYKLFKYRMLSNPPKKVYDRCVKIRFYECLHEYFQYKDMTDGNFLEKIANEETVYSTLWETYLKYEYLGVETWEDIEELLQVYISEGQINDGEEKAAGYPKECW